MTKLSGLFLALLIGYALIQAVTPTTDSQSDEDQKCYYQEPEMSDKLNQVVSKASQEKQHKEEQPKQEASTSAQETKREPDQSPEQKKQAEFQEKKGKARDEKSLSRAKELGHGAFGSVATRGGTAKADGNKFRLKGPTVVGSMADGPSSSADMTNTEVDAEVTSQSTSEYNSE